MVFTFENSRKTLADVKKDYNEFAFEFCSSFREYLFRIVTACIYRENDHRIEGLTEHEITRFLSRLGSYNYYA